jgi:hypothetical protein
VQHVDMEVQHVEFGRDFARRLEPRGGARIAAREKGHIMPPPHEFFGETGNDPLRSAVQARWAAFDEGGDLGDLHRRFSFRGLADGPAEVFTHKPESPLPSSDERD